MPFKTEDGLVVPAVSVAQMREVDRIAVETFGLTLLQMMENAGRNVAENIYDMLGAVGPVAILAGAGGNGGGGLCAARHLHNHGFPVSVILSGAASGLGDAASNQLRILQAAGILPMVETHVEEVLASAAIIVDALIGYGLRQAPRGRTAELIAMCNRASAPVLSLDVPSGIDASTGAAPGAVVRSARTLTLALPKVGLQQADGELYLGDIGIPPEVYQRVGVHGGALFRGAYWRRLLVY